MNPFPPWAVMCLLAGGLWIAAKLGTVLALGAGRPRAGASRFAGGAKGSGRGKGVSP